MNKTQLTERMHLVLDGEATPAEAQALEREIAGNPAARAQFERLRGLFTSIAAIPPAHPPEGLVAAVMAALPADAPGPSALAAQGAG